MADGRFKIPRVALAVLVLGGACGDDEKNDSGDDGGGNGDHDGGGHDEPDAGGGGDDGGGGNDAGAGSDAGSDGGGDSVDVSKARIQEVARDFCAQGFACEVEEVVGLFDDEAECRADSISYWEDYLTVSGEECIDAQLDLYACAALLSCDETVDDDCAELLEKTAELCSD